MKKIIPVFLLFGYTVMAQHTVTLVDTAGAIVAKVYGKPVLQYNYVNRLPPEGKEAYYQRSGFIHPAYTPEGDTITAGFPTKHTHHHGIFNAWVHTQFRGEQVDFWNQPDQKGTVIFKEILEKEEGEDYARFKTRQHHLAFIKGDSIVVLEEVWTITVYNSAEPFFGI